MFVQQLSHLNYDLDGLRQRISEAKPVEYAYLVHDRDIKDNGEKVEPHVHLALRFRNPVSLKQLAKTLNTEPQYIAQWRGSANNMYSYLVHRTNAAADRYQYPLDQVVASFDFTKKIEHIEQGIKNRSGKKDGVLLNETLDSLLEGEITLIEAFHSLPGRIAGKHRAKLQAAYQTHLELEAQRWREDKKDSKNPVQVFWFYGAAGVGKTRYAKEYLTGLDDGVVFISGSNRDPFQNYSETNAHKVILDDIRPNGNFSYEELLRMFDPWGIEVSVGSRYTDKNLQVDVYVVTSPLAPNVFVDTLQAFELDDKFDQMLRRLTAVMYFDDQYIYPALPYQDFDGQYKYDLDRQHKIENRWSGNDGKSEHAMNLVQEAKKKTNDFFTQITREAKTEQETLDTNEE
ncbi:ABC-type dipeptide/oligopeptide/nickel transport system [Fructobacillus fructosus]|uniref:Rep family protein n=1 Tax=Fructobacillus fructosus TaxID=1631 RepID=UPI002D95701B|nr:ABC-type dipeptide/oligopeptide/nickel transport system [Fructobacillus fructosus]